MFSFACIHVPKRRYRNTKKWVQEEAKKNLMGFILEPLPNKTLKLTKNTIIHSQLYTI